MKKHVNIPVFVPHLGCPNDCVFCDQRQISGHKSFDIGDARREIEEVLACVSDAAEKEIAFFGGSFTGIDRGLFLSLCALGKEYTDKGGVGSLRCSTRPDYINGEILDLLISYGFEAVELGVQSADDAVLSLCKRGHCVADTEHACHLIREHGLRLGGQMMIGLPGSSRKSERRTAEFICAMGAAEARVYPTVVFPNTELCRMYERGEYTPLGVEEAAERTADVLEIFDKHGVKVLRVGLCESEGLRRAVAGPSAPDMGERAMSRVFLRRALEAFAELGISGGDAVIEVGVGQTSKMCGHRKENTRKIQEKFIFNTLKVIEKTDIIGYNIKVKVLIGR
ncbi:MAG: radical SAM protein [Clostridia bacterium]|nr:radical SAM protein [Clostridia bacterium]